MAKGFDCATPLTASKAREFAGQGYTFVGRYLADAGSWKRLSPAEAQAITDAGLYIVSLFERYANRAREGARAGEFDGMLALQYAREVGQPEGSAIYFAVDYDAPKSDFDFIEAYMRAADQKIAGYELGVYGSYSVVKAMYERGVATKLMQTSAWSRGLKFDPISIYQYEHDITVNGIAIDLDESNGDAGGWKAGMLKPQEPPYLLAAEDANKIIAYLAASYFATDDPEAREEFHRLANALRKASGQPEE
jgi:hypothetical protein